MPTDDKLSPKSKEILEIVYDTMRVFVEYSVAVIDDNCQVILGERKLSCRTNFSVTQSAEKEPRQNLLGLIDMENRF